MVGVRGFEPTTPSPPTLMAATKHLLIKGGYFILKIKIVLTWREKD
jgi:hypothetical protein